MQLAAPKPNVTALVNRPRRMAGKSRGGKYSSSLAPGTGLVNRSTVSNTVPPYMARPTSAFDLVEQLAGSYIVLLLRTDQTSVSVPPSVCQLGRTSARCESCSALSRSWTKYTKV
jgi:hypothetical protein